MTTSRKTVHVDTVKKMANEMMLHSTDDRAKGREAISILLENILHKTGNYRGYNMLTKETMERESKSGTTVGVNYDEEKGIPCEDFTERFANCDDTRRYYY